MTKTLTIENELEQLDTVHDEILDFLHQHGAVTSLAEEMFLVAEEVLVNTISYGYDDDDVHRIEIELSCHEQVFGMRFTDRAREFDPLAAEEPDLDASTEERGIGGLGIHLVKVLTDEASYRREGDANILTLKKRIS